MTNLQKKLLELLCEIDEICQKHDIKYCLFAGTGLGADRHGGFIPWDDDADIIMTLENYEKFLSVFENEAKDGRVLNCLEYDQDHYPFTYARYVDINTSAIQRHTAFGGCDPGVKIDIFVAVPTHESVNKAEAHLMEILAFSEVICPYALMNSYRPNGFKEVYDHEKKLFDKLGRSKYIAKRMNKLKYYKRSSKEKYVLFSGMMCNSYIFDAEILDDIEYVPYENTNLPISRHNLKFTKQLYGEGWAFKPADVDTPRHTYLLDMDKPYKEYLDILWDKTDYDEARDIALKRKQMHLHERENYKDVIVNNQMLTNLSVEMDINNRFSQDTSLLQDNWNSAYISFDRYYKTQLKKINTVYKMFITVNDDAFECAMNSAIMVGKYYEAADIINAGLASGSLLGSDKRLDLISKRIDICRDLTEALYLYKDLEKVKHILNDNKVDMVAGSLTYETAALWAEAIEYKSNAEYEELCDRIDSSIAKHLFTGELLVIKGYCMEKMDKTKEALELFDDAVQIVTNGFVYQYLLNRGFGKNESQQ